MKYQLDLNRDLFMLQNLHQGVGSQQVAQFITSYNSLIPRGDLRILAGVAESVNMYGIVPGQSKIYGIANVASNSKMQIYVLNIPIDQAPSSFASDWSALANQQTATVSGAGAFYQNSIFCTATNGDLYRYNLTAGAWVSVTSGSGQSLNGIMVRHPSDDILYLLSNTAIYYVNGATGTLTSGFALPAYSTATAMSAIGDFLYVGESNTFQNSYVAVWDRDTSLTTLSAHIDVGPGTVIAVNKLEGGNIIVLTVDSVGVLTVRQIVDDKSVVINTFGLYNNQKTFQFLPTNSQGTYCDGRTISFYGTHYDLNTDGSTNANAISGIFSIDAKGQLTTSQIFNGSTYQPNGNTNSGNVLYRQNDFFIFSAWKTASSLPEVLETGVANTMATFESRAFGPKLVKEKVTGVTLASEPLLTSASMSLYHKAAGSVTWTLVGTHNTAGATSASFTRYSDGTFFPELAECQWKVTVTNGLSIPTSILWETDRVDKRPYGDDSISS